MMRIEILTLTLLALLALRGCLLKPQPHEVPIRLERTQDNESDH